VIKSRKSIRRRTRGKGGGRRHNSNNAKKQGKDKNQKTENIIDLITYEELMYPLFFIPPLKTGKKLTTALFCSFHFFLCIFSSFGAL